VSLKDVLAGLRGSHGAPEPRTLQSGDEIGFMFLNLETEARIDALARRFNVEPPLLITMALDALEDAHAGPDRSTG